MKFIRLIACLLALLMLFGCGQSATPQGTESAEKSYPTFEFTHYSSGGNAETYEAVILYYHD